MASKPKNPTPPTTRPAAPRTTTPADTVAAQLNSPRSPGRGAPSDEQILARAYYLWERPAAHWGMECTSGWRRSGN